MREFLTVRSSLRSLAAAVMTNQLVEFDYFSLRARARAPSWRLPPRMHYQQW
jgi:hypothetical protein